MHNCYSNRAYMHGYCSHSIYYFMFFSLSSPLTCQTLSHPLFNSKKEKKKKQKQLTITTNQPPPPPPPPTHYNINLIQTHNQPKINENHHKPNLNSNNNKKYNRKPIWQNTNQPKTQACRRLERERVSVLSHGSLVERFFSNLKRTLI